MFKSRDGKENRYFPQNTRLYNPKKSIGDLEMKMCSGSLSNNRRNNYFKSMVIDSFKNQG
jgi:hypothetical protein